MKPQRIYRGGLQYHDHPAREKHEELRLHDGYWQHYHDEGGMVAVGEDEVERVDLESLLNPDR